MLLRLCLQGQNRENQHHGALNVITQTLAHKSQVECLLTPLEILWPEAELQFDLLVFHSRMHKMLLEKAL